MKVVLLGNQADTLFRFRKDFIRTLLSEKHDVILVSPCPNAETENEIRALGAKFIPLKLNRTSQNPIVDFKTFLNVFKILKLIKPDILLCFTIKPVIYGSIASKLAGVKYCHSMITGTGAFFAKDTLSSRLTRMVVKVFYRMSLDINKTVIFLNEEDLKMFVLEKWLKDSRKAVLIPGEGVNLDEYQFSEVQEGDITFLFMARLLIDKGILEYVGSAKILKKKYPSVKFQVLGSMDENPASIKRTTLDQWVDDGIIEYLGFKADVRPYLKKCTVFVLPSYGEGMPRSSMEALATGRPIITTDCKGCRDTVKNSENGFLVPIRDINSLTMEMEKFIKDPTLASRMGIASRKLSEDKFDVNRINELILEKLSLRASRAKISWDTPKVAPSVKLSESVLTRKFNLNRLLKNALNAANSKLSRRQLK